MDATVHPSAYQERHLIEFYRRDQVSRGLAVPDAATVDVRAVMAHYGVTEAHAQQQIHDLFATKYPGMGPGDIISDLEESAIDSVDSDMDDEDLAAQTLAPDFNVAALAAALKIEASDCRESVRAIEDRYGAPASGGTSVTPALLLAMGRHHGCSVERVSAIVPGYAIIVRDAEARDKTGLIRHRIQEKTESMKRNLDAQRAALKQELENEIAAMHGECAEDDQRKNARMFDELEALVDNLAI